MSLGPPRRISAVLLAAALATALALAAPVATAQMQLPGAVNGGGTHESGGAVGSGTSGAPPYVPPKPVVIEAPSEDGISGHVLSHDGAKGGMTFDKSASGLTLSKLTLAGSKISKPGQACTVDVPLATPLSLNAAGRPAGAIRYGVPVPSCPFNIDILDGAALVTSPGPTCDFIPNDCRASPGGLWGPRAADITPKRVKDLEHERARWEITMRANFRALLKKAGRDRTTVKTVAREQAAFSSEREMTCRDYAQETVHGFCSTQVTEARALALLAQFGPFVPARDRKHAARPSVRPPAPQQGPSAEAQP